MVRYYARSSSRCPAHTGAEQTQESYKCLKESKLESMFGVYVVHHVVGLVVTAPAPVKWEMERRRIWSPERGEMWALQVAGARMCFETEFNPKTVLLE